MRKFLVVLLALGFVVAFSMPAAATDVTFSGTYWVKGMLESNPNKLAETETDGESQQDWYAQRLRVVGTWAVADGLTLNTRMDVMEKIWGSGDDYYSNADGGNISWERCFVTYKSPIGKFDVGYMSAGGFGTVFNDDVGSAPRIKYTGVFGPVIVLALTEKGTEKDGIATTFGADNADGDYDKYALAVMYKFEGGIAGALWFYLPDRTNDAVNLVRNYLPVYFKWTLGDLYLEGEASYFWGTYEYDSGQADKDISGKSWYLYGKYKLGPAYVGAQYGYVEYGKNDATDWETGYYDNSDWDPCLILFNYWLNVYQNNESPATSQIRADLGLNNGSLYQVFGGFSPMENLTIHASLSYAEADTVASGWDKEYGTEFDLTATWKIVDQLEYMIGFGYLFTGDYYKQGNSSTEVEDDYLVMHQLTLNF
jgi:hypothetical protein